MTGRFLEDAERVLASIGRPMSAEHIVEEAGNSREFDFTRGKTPGRTLNARLIDDIRRNGAASKFKRTGAGRFALRA